MRWPCGFPRATTGLPSWCARIRTSRREAANLDKAIIAAVSNEPSKRDAAAEQRIRDRIAVIAKERDDLQAVLTREFPDYAALSNPQPLTVKDIQALLADDEALVVIDLGDKKSYVWAITRERGGLERACGLGGRVAKGLDAPGPA